MCLLITSHWKIALKVGWLIGWLSEFNVGLELPKWAFADGLGFSPEDDPERCRHNFHLPWRGWLPCLVIPRGIIWMGTWRTWHPRQILHAPSAINLGPPIRNWVLSRFVHCWSYFKGWYVIPEIKLKWSFFSLNDNISS